jgi:hypothetical protein
VIIGSETVRAITAADCARGDWAYHSPDEEAVCRGAESHARANPGHEIAVHTVTTRDRTYHEPVLHATGGGERGY